MTLPRPDRPATTTRPTPVLTAAREDNAVWNLRGSTDQNALIQQALDRCDFPFDTMAPSLQREGKQTIDVTWADLSRYGHTEALAHDHAAGAHTITRQVDGRSRVLGLFYLPPHTRIVLDNGLTSRPALAWEVFLAEGAHAVDYHYMTNDMRAAVWNALHDDHDDLAPGTTVHEFGDLGHGHSWFDGPGGYATWVGESWMAAFIKAFAPTVPVTINLDHPISGQAAKVIRKALIPGAVFASVKGRVYHDAHRGIRQDRTWPSAQAATEAGLRPCKVCRP